MYLKNPQVFTRLGGKLPRGLMLTGPPGTGEKREAYTVLLDEAPRWLPCILVPVRSNQWAMAWLVAHCTHGRMGDDARGPGEVGRASKPKGTFRQRDYR